MADSDRGYISQYSQEEMGISVIVGSTLTDADGNVTVTVTNEDTGAVLFTRTATHSGVGLYQVTLTPDDNTVLGNYLASWSYELSSEAKTFLSYYSVGGAEPAYDNLSDGMKAIVDQVWILFADQFDSPSGGPNLQTWAMSNFNRGRIAQLLKRAVGLINTMAQPFSTYTLDGVGGAAFPIAQWGPLLVQALYVEVLKHLQRSYLEQPDWEGGAGISRLDRRAYRQYYAELVEQETETLRPQLDIFKISQMGLARPSILVSGGVWGRQSYYNRPQMAARPGIWTNAFS